MRVKQDAMGQKHKHNSQEQLLCLTSPIQKTQTHSHNNNKTINHQQHVPHNHKNKENTRQQLTNLRKAIEEGGKEKPALDQHLNCGTNRPNPKHTTRTSRKNITQGGGGRSLLPILQNSTRPLWSTLLSPLTWTQLQSTQKPTTSTNTYPRAPIPREGAETW